MTSSPLAVGRKVAGGAALIGLGLTVTGLGTLVMMSLAARSLMPAEFAALAVWWTLGTLLGTGFGVFENYLARLVVADLSSSRDPGSVTGVLLGRTLISAALVAAVLVIGAPWLASGLLADSWGTTLLLPVYVTLAAAQAFQRGAAAGRGRFRATAGQLVVDGLLRAGCSAALVATGRDSLATLSAGACLAAAAGLAVGGILCPDWLARPRRRAAVRHTRPLLPLLVATGGPLLVNNGPVPWLAGTHTVGAQTVGAFAGAVTLSRLPTQFIAAAFAPLFTQLAHCVETGDRQTFQRLRHGALLLAGVSAALFVAVFAVAGPPLLQAYLGPGYHLSRSVLAVLAAASGLMFIVFVRQAALTALHRWSLIAQAWVAATAAFMVVLVLTPVSSLSRATVAPTAAVLVALAVMSLRRTRWPSEAP